MFAYACASHAAVQALRGCTLVEQPEMCVAHRSAWASMNTDASAAAAALAAAAPAVMRVVKRRKARHDMVDECACEQLLGGEGEVAAALRVYSPSDIEDANESESCESDDDSDDDDDVAEDNEGRCDTGGSEGGPEDKSQADCVASAQDGGSL